MCVCVCVYVCIYLGSSLLCWCFMVNNLVSSFTFSLSLPPSPSPSPSSVSPALFPPSPPFLTNCHPHIEPSLRGVPRIERGGVHVTIGMQTRYTGSVVIRWTFGWTFGVRMRARHERPMLGTPLSLLLPTKFCARTSFHIASGRSGYRTVKAEENVGAACICTCTYLNLAQP